MSLLARLWSSKSQESTAGSDVGYLTGTIWDVTALDRLLADIERELKTTRALIVRRLYRDHKLGGSAICWSYPEVQGKDLDYQAAGALLTARLASIGVGLDGSPTFSSDDDGCTLLIWWYGHVRYSDAPPRLRGHIERLETLDADAQKDEARRLVRSGQYALLVAWLCEAMYKNIPADVLRESNDATAATLLIRLLSSPYPDIRARAADALGPLGGTEAARALCALLGHSEDDTLAVAFALFRLPSTESVPSLTTALHRASDVFHQIYLAKALARSGGNAGFTFLIEGLEQRHRRRECVEALLAVDDARAVPALGSHLRSLQLHPIVDSSLQKRIEDFLARHGAPRVELPRDGAPQQIRTTVGIVADEAPWSVQAGVLELKKAIQNTWNVRCQIVQLTEEQSAYIRRQFPMQEKQWVADGQYQIELSHNSIFVHAYGSWVDLGPLLFLYQERVWYVNVAFGVELTRFMYDRTDDLSHMAKIAITLLGYIGGRERGDLLVCLDGDLFQASVSRGQT